MTTYDVVEQILDEMELKWKFHDGGSYCAYVIDCYYREIWVYCGGTSIKLSLWDKLDRVEIYAKEANLYSPNSIQEIRQLLLVWSERNIISS